LTRSFGSPNLRKDQLRDYPGGNSVVPLPECWRDEKKERGFCRTKPGDEVDICVMPIWFCHT
jgi:hypothetical protein